MCGTCTSAAMSGDNCAAAPSGRRPPITRFIGWPRNAVADLATRCAQAGGAAIDAQWDSPFLRSLGEDPMPRARYLSMLATGSSRRLALPQQALPARRLLELPAARE